MSNNSWKQYGGISKMDNFNTINASTIIADQFVSRSVRPTYQLLNGTFEVTEDLISGNSSYSNVDTFSNRDIYTNNKLFFGNNTFVKDGNNLPTLTDVQKITHAYLYGNDTNIGINTIIPKTSFNITGTVGSITDILTVESKNVLVRNIIAQNINQRGIVVNADDISSNILFYNDVSTNSINVPDAMIKYQDGGLLTTQTTEHILSTAKIIQHDSSGGTLLMNSTGTTLNSSGYLDVDISGEINFYTDTGFIFDSSNDFIINCSGTLLSLNDLSCNLNSTGNIILSSFGQDGLGGNIVLDSSGGIIEFNSGDIKLNTLLKFSPPERGVSNELLHNETVTIYDNDNTQFLPNVYNDPTILTGNSTTFIGKDSSANTFIFMNPATRKDGGAIGGGMAPHDSSRAMTVIGTTDSSGNYIPSQMTISGANKHKYISTVGINTHKPRTEDYVLDVNGPMHLGNGEINTIADNTYEITSMSFSKKPSYIDYGIAVGSPSTKTGSGVNKTENALLSSANTLTDPIDEGTYNNLQTISTRPSTGTTGGIGAELTIVALEDEITSITVTDSGNDYAAGDILIVTADVLANTGRETPLIFTLTADHIVDVAEYNQILLYTNDGGKKWNKSDIFEKSGLNADIAISMRYIDVFDDSYSAIAGENGNLFISNDSGQSWYKLQLKGVDTGTIDYKTINIVESNTHRIFISYTIGDSNTGTTGIYYFDCNLSTIFTPIDTSDYLTTDTTIEIKTYIKAYESTTTTDNYYITSASSTDTRVYYAGINGAFSYDNTISYDSNPNPLKLGNISHNNNIYAFDDTHAIAVSTTGISYTTDGLTWTHKIFGTDLGLPDTMVLNSVFIQSLSNAIAVGSQGEFIYSTDWQNGVWQMVPDNLLNSSGMRDRIRGSENNLKSISMPDIDTMIIADTITTFVSNDDFTRTELGYSKIQYCFLPNLFNHTNNTVLDVSGNSTFDGHITGQATLVINDSNPNTFTVSNAAVNANTKAITLTTTDALTLTDGSVNFIMDGIGATSLRGATTFDLDASGIISINSTDADINIGNDTIMVDQAINIGTGESARTITVGNATGTTKLDIHSGTEGIDIDTTGNISFDASGNISFDAVNESNSRSIDIGKKTHIVDIGKTDEQSVIQPVINQIYNDFASVINIGVSDPIINPDTEDASRVLINIGNYKQNALEGNRKSNIINIGGGKDILSLGGTITYSSTEVSTSKNKGFQINESHPLHDGIDAYINQAGNTLNMTGIVDTDGIYSYTFTNPAYNAYEFQYKSIHNNPITHEIIVAYMAANSFNNDNIPGGSTPLSNTDMDGIALNNSSYEYSATNPDLEEYIVNTYKPYNSGAGSGIRVTDNLDRDAGYLIVSDDLNGWSMKPTKYGSNSLKIDVNSLVLRDDNGYIEGTDVSGIHDIKNGIVMLTKTDTEATNYKLSVQQIDISNILVRDSNTSTLNKQFVNTELVVQNDVSFNKDLSIGGDVFIEGQLSATSVLNTYVINTTTTDYEFIVTQDMSLNGILFVGGDASFNSNMEISGNVAIGKQNPVVTLDISATDALRLPVGTTVQRPIKVDSNSTSGYSDENNNEISYTDGSPSELDKYIGSIRYNESNSQFEGFGPGKNWGSLGGVINVAQNTKIMASSPNPDSSNNQLQFFTANIGTIVGALTIGTTSHPHDLLTSVSNSLTEYITAGTYEDLSTTTNGNGSGAILKIVASTNLITSVIVTTAGSGYAVGDTIAVTAAHLSAVASRNTPLNITLTANDIVNNAAERMRIDSNGNVGIGTTSPNVILDINGTDALRLPIGVTNDRPIDKNDNGFLQLKGASVDVTAETKMDDGDISGYIGSIRYNTSNKQFEGFGPGNDWGSLGGVINVAQTTKITAESSPAATNNQLRFYTANSGAAQLQMIIDASSGGVAIGTDYASDVSNNTDISDNSLIVQGKVGIGTKSPNCILDISATDALRLPVGTTGQRPIKVDSNSTSGYSDENNNEISYTDGSPSELDKYIGSIRYNESNSQFEGFGPGKNWGSLGGVINVAQNTKITASSPNADSSNNQLQFYTAPKVGILNTTTDHFTSRINTLTAPIDANGDWDDLPITGGTGSGAKLKIRTSSANYITQVTVTDGGSGYIKGDVLTVTAATLTTEGTGRNTDLVFTLTTEGYAGGLSTENTRFTNRTGTTGHFITPGTYDDLPITGGTGSGAKLKIVANESGILNITVTTPGSGYSANDDLKVTAADFQAANTGRDTDLEFTLNQGDDDFFQNDINLSSNDGNMAERMIVDANGYVGIGTTAPTALLEVNGDALINGLTVGRGGGNISTNTAFGIDALKIATNSSSGNTAFGYQTLMSNTTGNNNVALCYQSLQYNTTGTYNLAASYRSLQANTTGDYNIALGMQSLSKNTTGDYNIAIGYNALYDNTIGKNNIAIGYDALTKTNGSAGNNKLGINNTAFGNSSGKTNTTGSNNTYIGAYSDCSSNNLKNSVAIGCYSKITKDHQIVLGGEDSGQSVSFPEVYIPGNLGIGTSDPSYALDINDGIIRTNYTASTILHHYPFRETIPGDWTQDITGGGTISIQNDYTQITKKAFVTSPTFDLSGYMFYTDGASVSGKQLTNSRILIKMIGRSWSQDNGSEYTEISILNADDNSLIDVIYKDNGHGGNSTTYFYPIICDLKPYITTSVYNIKIKIAIVGSGSMDYFGFKDFSICLDDNSPWYKDSVYKQQILGGASIGVDYVGQNLNNNELLVQGNVGIGTTDPTARLRVVHGSTTDAEKNISAMDIFKNFDGVTNNNTYPYAGRIYGTDGTTVNETGIKVCEKDDSSLTSNDTKVLNVISDGQSKMVVTGAGNVGIGTNSPTALLDVSGGDALIHGITVGRGAGGMNTNLAIGVNSLQNVNPDSINNLGDANVAIGYESLKDCSGGRQNVAIGYKPLRYCKEGVQNFALGELAGSNIINGNYNAFIGAAAGGTVDVSFGLAIGTWTQLNHNFSTVIGTLATSTKENQIVLGGENGGQNIGFPDVYIPGKLGIGTDDPEGLLHISSAGDTILKITGDNGDTTAGDSTHPYLIFQQDGIYNEAGIFLDNGNDLNISACTNGGGDIIFRTGTTSSNSNTDITNLTGADTRMTIGSNGNVGIGINPPTTTKLEVNGNTQVHGKITFKNSNWSGISDGAYVQFIRPTSESNPHTDIGGTSLQISELQFVVSDDNSDDIGFYPSGQVNCSKQLNALSFNATSDIRHKENIIELENSLEKITSLRAVNYNFKETPNIKAAGLIAQEVDKVIPEAISKRKADKWTLDYNSITGYLVDCIKELKQENDTIKQENETLKTKVNSLETKIEMIMKHLNL